MDELDYSDLKDDDFFGDLFSSSNTTSTTTKTQTSENKFSHLFRNSTTNKPKATVSLNAKDSEKLINFSSVLCCDDLDLDLDLFNFNYDGEKKIPQENEEINRSNLPTAEPQKLATPQSSASSPNPQYSAVLAKFQRKKSSPVKYKSRLSTNETTDVGICEQTTVPYDKNDNEIIIQKSRINTYNRRTPITPPNQTRKRKFPGPAGFLPPLDAPEKNESCNEDLRGRDEYYNVLPRIDSDKIPCSQIDENEYTQGPWSNVQSDIFDQVPYLSKFNIAWLLKQVNSKKLPNYEMPILIASIKSFNITGATASVVLRDKFGEISGTVHKQLLDQDFSFQIGSVVILHKISVFRPNRENLSAIITPKTLLRIYTNEKDGSSTCISLRDESRMELNQRLLEAVTSAESTLETSKNEDPNPISSLKIAKLNDTLSTTNSYPGQSPVDNAEWDESDAFDELISNINEEELLKL